MIYAAFLRGIMPTNPNMRNEKIRSVFESLGFKNIQSVIASGNFIFESKETETGKLEDKIDKALMKHLNINCPAFIRSEKDLKKIIKKDPFKGGEHSSKTYLIVTFLKKKPFEIYTIVDTTVSKTPEFMGMIDKKYAKQNTTRTWKTVQRIFAKIEAAAKK